MVPTIAWRIIHQFRDLEGAQFLNPGLRNGSSLLRAIQMIQFKLDRSGMELKSDATLDGGYGGPGQYHVDRPFLLYAKKRGSARPFFAMWINNDELLSTMPVEKGWVVEKRVDPLVGSFVVPPTGNEIWWYGREWFSNRQRAYIHRPSDGTWSAFPDEKSQTSLESVLFSKDGRIAWAGMCDSELAAPILFQRSDGQSWKEVTSAKDWFGFSLQATADESELWSVSYRLSRFQRNTGTCSYSCDSSQEARDGEFPIVGSVSCLMFTPDGRFAITDAQKTIHGTSHKQFGINVIDLKSGESTHYKCDLHARPVRIDPDNRTVWCSVESEDGISRLWVFDLVDNKWSNRLEHNGRITRAQAEPLRDANCFLADRHYWVVWPDHTSVFSFGQRTWISFATPNRLARERSSTTSADGQYLIAGHTRGVAIASAEHKTVDVVPVAPAAADCKTHCFARIPNSNDLLCALAHPTLGGVYRVNPAQKELTLLKRLNEAHICAIAIINGGIWVASDKMVRAFDGGAALGPLEIPNTKGPTAGR